MGESYNQKDAEGFIRILSLPARSQAILARAAKAAGAAAPRGKETAGVKK
jgi:hypothetical protein